jgi:cytochrome c oxidase subunit 2
MRRALLCLASLLLAGCDTVQSITGGDGRHASLFNQLFALFLVVSLVMYVLVVAFLAMAVFRRRGSSKDRLGRPGEQGESRETMLEKGLIGWTALIAFGLTILTIATYATDRSMAKAAPPKPVLEIEVTGNQWWWDVRYMDESDPSHIIHTANELHLPVGTPARIILKSNDVIHSFWVPNLAGKQDLIPGRVNDMMLLPEKIGYYRSQCAEYCGAQHAHMALDVTVESRTDFDAWRSRQLMAAPPPSNPLTQAGYSYFMGHECSGCHAIAGTPAMGQVAPDLTHLRSRRSIGAGTFPMSRGHLYAWVADPQGPKPGNNMPVIGLDADQLHALIAYLETLQ